MERLTEHVGDYIRIKGCETLYPNEERKTAPASNAIVRLAAYEDAMPLERAQELAQAAKDGRLVVLPKGIVSMIMAAFIDKGDKDMVTPLTEARGDEAHVFGLLSYLADVVAKCNHTDYVSLLKTLIENPIV